MSLFNIHLYFYSLDFIKTVVFLLNWIWVSTNHSICFPGIKNEKVFEPGIGQLNLSRILKNQSYDFSFFFQTISLSNILIVCHFILDNLPGSWLFSNVSNIFFSKHLTLTAQIKTLSTLQPTAIHYILI